MHKPTDEALDALAMKISDCIEGEDLLNIATVCSRVIAYAIHTSYRSDKDAQFEAMGRLTEFMHRDLRNMIRKDHMQ